MKVKKYKASTMQEAMQQVRIELGEEAVILNSKVIKTSKFFGLLSKKGVEVIAAVDEVPVEQIAHTIHRPSVPSSVMKKNVGSDNNQITKPSSNPQDIKDSIDEMKRMMKGLAKGNLRDPLLPEYFYEIEEKLTNTDLPASLMEEAMKTVYSKWLHQKALTKIQMVELVEEFLLEKLSGIDYSPNTYHRRFISLVGPTGVGKTTTLAKLAGNAVLKHGKTVGFITTDTYRIGAIEQLKTYANILEVPIEVCYNSSDFQDAKEKLAHLDVIFIDTAGRNFLNGSFIKELQNVIGFEDEMTTFLVLSLTSKLKDMQKITDQFRQVGFHHFIFTKKDETASTGAMFTLLQQYKKGVSFITNGQSVPEDLIPVTKADVVEDVLEEIKQ